jgi:hypothetical protein
MKEYIRAIYNQKSKAKAGTIGQHNQKLTNRQTLDIRANIIRDQKLNPISCPRRILTIHNSVDLYI